MNQHTRRSERHLATTLAVALIACASAGLACASDEKLADAWVTRETERNANTPLAGEALFQRKIELDRSYRDLSHFGTTLQGLHRRGDRGGAVVFSEFVEFYIAKHVLPLLDGEWQSRHPEAAVLDANVRFAVAELWLRMGSNYSTDEMIEEIERRYAGRGEMVVGYPLGAEGTLADGLALLRNRDWWGG